MPELPSTEPLTTREKLGYGLGDAACNVVFQMVLTFMAYFYTDVFGLAPAAMGTMFLVVRLVNSFADPIMGAICDRTETRWGKFRPYLLWMCVPFAVLAVLAFVTPDFAEPGKLVYAYGTYLLLTMVYTAINVPYCALGAVITPNQRERVSLNGYRFFLATAAGAVIASTTLPLVELLGGGDDRRGFPLTMAVFTTVGIGLFLACFALTQERVKQAAESTSDLWTDVKLLVKNDQWLIVAALNFVLFIALVLRDGAAIYYMRWYFGRTDLIGAFLTTGNLSSMLGALSAGWLGARLSKVAAYSLLQAIIIVFSVAMYFVGSDQVALIFLLYGLQQFTTQMASPFLWSMMADSVDYGEFVSGRRITGLTFSGALFALKMGMAAGGAILGWLLGYYGYQSHAEAQSPEAIAGIVVLFTLAPAIGHGVLMCVVRLYRLNDQRCEEICMALAERQVTRAEVQAEQLESR